MRESTFAGGWKTERYSDSRSRFDERLGSKPEYGSENRSFPPPSRSSGSFGSNSGSFSNRDNEGSRYSRSSRNYDDEGPSRFGNSGPSKYSSGGGSGGRGGSSNFSSSGGGGGGRGGSSNFGSSGGGSSNFGGSGGGSSNFGSSGPGNFGNNGPPQNYGNDESSNFGNSGPNYRNNGPGYNSSGPSYGGGSGPNFGNNGPPPPSRPKDMGPSQGSMGGPPMRGMGNQNFGNGPNEADIISSIHTLSQMNAQQNDIATKIISAVLSTNLMGGGNLQGPPFRGGGFIGNQQGPPFEGQMGGFSDRNQFPPSRSSRPGGPGPPPRRSGPPGGPSRFSRERLRSPRITYPSNGGPRSSYDKRYSLNSRSSLVKKRSLSSSSPRDSSKIKRRRSISRERKDGKREEDNDVKKESDTEEKEDSEKKDDIPLAALYCHMCKHGNFASVKTYLYHLDGIKHRKTAMAFHARNEATLEYLRKNAKLANVRFGGKDPSVPSSKCTVCTAIIKETFAKHKRLLEHKVVKKFMSPTCCSRYFKTRYEMNEHRLSLPHLKKMYEVTEQQKIYLDDVKAKPGKWNHDDIVKQLIARNPVPEKHITLDNIPPFDGNTFIGIKFLRAKDATLCKPCKLLLPVGIKSLETHMVSIEHYDNVMDYLREKKKRRLEAGDRKKGEGEEGANSDSDSDDDNAEENAEGVRYSRDHDKEEEEEDEEDAVHTIKVSDDEEDLEEKDDMPFYDETAHIVLEEIGEDLPKQKQDEDDDVDLEAEIEGDDDEPDE